MRFQDFLSSIGLGTGTSRGERVATLLSVFTPAAAADSGPGAKLLLAGGTLAVFGLSLLLATGAALQLLLAVGIIYFLMTQILGVRFELDPQLLVPQPRRPAQASAPN
jgi:hypothetical protein